MGQGDLVGRNWLKASMEWAQIVTLICQPVRNLEKKKLSIFKNQPWNSWFFSKIIVISNTPWQGGFFNHININERPVAQLPWFCLQMCIPVFHFHFEYGCIINYTCRYWAFFSERSTYHWSSGRNWITNKENTIPFTCRQISDFTQ